MLTEDPQFARATVNLVWSELMGVGIVDPPLDFDLARLDPANPPPAPWTIQPSHPELLEALAKDFREHKCDLRRLIRLIVTSSTYQLSSHFEGEWKAAYAPYFARHFVRRLPAEEIADAISQATEIFPSISISESNVKVGYVLQARSSEDLGGKDLEPLRLLLASFGQADRDKMQSDRVEKSHSRLERAAKTETDKILELLQSNTDLTQQDKQLTEQVADLTKQIHALLTKQHER